MSITRVFVQQIGELGNISADLLLFGAAISILVLFFIGVYVFLSGFTDVEHDERIENIRVFGRYGLVFAGFLIFTSLRKTDEISADAYISLLSLVIGGLAGYSARGRNQNDQSGSDQPGSDQPDSDQPGSDQPGSDQPGSDQPGSDQPSSDDQSDED